MMRIHVERCDGGIVAVTLRESQPEDAQGITDVHIKSWQETYRGLMPDSYLDSLNHEESARRLGRWQERLGNPDERKLSWIAEVDRIIIGFVSIGKCRDERPIADGEIYAIYLLKKYHGSGVGRALFERGFELLRNLGFLSASLWVVKGNPTEGFYRHLGGILRGEKIDSCGGISGIAEHRYVWSELFIPTTV